ncbi:MAG: outer membrane protein assembly factor BamA [Desulfurivibrionaceae bacterium]
MSKSNSNYLATALLCCLLAVPVPPVDHAGAAVPEAEQTEAFEEPAPSSEPREVKSHELTVTGNAYFSEKELLESAARELERFRERGYRKADIDDAAFRMRLAYLEAGFAFVSVDYTYERQAELVKATIKVEEGPRVLVDEINFVGNRRIETDTLREFFSRQQGLFAIADEPVFEESKIKSLVGRIRDYYRGEGFNDVSVESPAFSFNRDRSEVDITIEIKEGPRYFIEEVQLSGDLVAELAPKLEEIKEEYTGKTYFPRRKLLLRSSLEEAYDRIGYADAGIAVEALESAEPGRITLAAEIAGGEKVRIGDVIISGNESTRESFIRNRVQLQPGDLYTRGKRRESFRKLFDSGLFAKVDIELAPPGEEGARDLLVEVEELPSIEIYVEPGWGSYEQLRFGTGITEKNLFGTGRSGRLDGLLSTKGGNLTLSYTDPWLLKSDISMTVPLHYERREEPSYTSEETGLGVYFSRKFGSKLTLTTGYQYKMTQLIDLTDETILQEEDDYTKGTVTIQAVRDTRNDIFFPSGGMRLAAGFDLSIPEFASEIELARITLGSRYFIEIPNEYIVGVRFSTGLIIPLGDQRFIPVSERFFNGGDNTVRSYRHSELGLKDANHEPLGGLGYNVFSLELRKRIYGNFAATVYLDAGNVSPNDSLFGSDFSSYTDRSELLDDTLADYFNDFKYGIGVGLQYLLPVGPIRIDFAWNPDPLESRDEDEWVFHFSLGMAF